MDARTLLIAAVIALFCVETIAADKCFKCTNQVASRRKKRDSSDDLVTQLKTQVMALVKHMETAGTDEESLKTMNTVLDALEAVPGLDMAQMHADTVKSLLISRKARPEKFISQAKDTLGKMLNKISEGAADHAAYVASIQGAGVFTDSAEMHVGGDCEDGFDKETTKVKECEATEGQSCAKIRVDLGGKTSYIRDCLPEAVCGADNYHCCKGDKCNGAPKGSFNIIILVISTIAVFWFNK